MLAKHQMKDLSEAVILRDDAALTLEDPVLETLVAEGETEVSVGFMFRSIGGEDSACLDLNYATTKDKARVVSLGVPEGSEVETAGLREAARLIRND